MPENNKLTTSCTPDHGPDWKNNHKEEKNALHNSTKELQSGIDMSAYTFIPVEGTENATEKTNISVDFTEEHHSLTDLTIANKGVLGMKNEQTRPRSHTTPIPKQDVHETERPSKVQNRQPRTRLTSWPAYYSRMHTDSISEPVPSIIFDEHYEIGDTSDISEPEANNEHVKVKGLRRSIKAWRNTLEPNSSRFLLFCSVIPINILLGIDFICFPIYYVEYVQYFHDATISTIAIIVAVKYAMMSFLGVVTSVFINRFGCRTVSISGGIISVIAVLASSFAINIPMLVITQGFLLGFGCSGYFISLNLIVQRSFKHNRAMAGGLAMLGVTIGNVTGAPLVNFLVDMYGWRGTLLVQGALMANAIPLSILMPPKSREIPHSKRESDGTVSHVDCNKSNIKSHRKCSQFGIFLKDVSDFSLFKEAAFFLLCLGACVDRFNIQIFLPHLANRAVYLGMTRADGATFLSTFSMSLIVCRIAVTFLSNLDNVRRTFLYTSGAFVGGIASFTCTVFSSFKGHILAAAIHGIHIGLANTLMWVMLVDVMGLERLPRAMALYSLAYGIAGMTATPLSGLLYDLTKNYDPPYLLAGASGILAGTLTLTTSILDMVRKKKQECNAKKSTDQRVSNSIQDLKTEDSA